MTDAKLEARQKALLDGARQFFADAHPLFGLLQLDPRRISGGEIDVAATLTEEFRLLDGEPAVHGGVLTILMDTVFGFSVHASLSDLEPIATINLRSDYIREPEVGAVVTCRAVCGAIRDQVAYVSGDVVSEAGEVVARGSGTFLIGTRGPRFSGLKRAAS